MRVFHTHLNRRKRSKGTCSSSTLDKSLAEFPDMVHPNLATLLSHLFHSRTESRPVAWRLHHTSGEHIRTQGRFARSLDVLWRYCKLASTLAFARLARQPVVLVFSILTRHSWKAAARVDCVQRVVRRRRRPKTAPVPDRLVSTMAHTRGYGTSSTGSAASPTKGVGLLVHPPARPNRATRVLAHGGSRACIAPGAGGRRRYRAGGRLCRPRAGPTRD